MKTVYASQGGFVSNTAVVDTNILKNPAEVHPPAPPFHSHPQETAGSGLGGDIGKLAAALDTIGWNHGQVPRDERMPVDEQQLEQSYYAGTEEAKGKLKAAATAAIAVAETEEEPPELPEDSDSAD